MYSIKDNEHYRLLKYIATEILKQKFMIPIKILGIYRGLEVALTCLINRYIYK